MAAVAFHKVTTLPATPQAHAWYAVLSGGKLDLWLTDAAGAAQAVFTENRVNTLADARIASAFAAQNAMEIVADITARNALAAGFARNALVLVTDATGDATVAAGAALYAWNDGAGSWTKLTEFESMDASLAWASITGRPSSTPAQIDDAVTKRHTHTNQTFLDKIGETGGALTYDGAAVGTAWLTSEW